MPELKTPKKDIWFLPALAVFALASLIRYSREYMSTYTTTLYAMNYDYGFVSQGFLGTLYRYVSERVPWEMQNHMAVFNFCGAVTLIYFLVLFLFYGICLHYCSEENKRNLKHLLVFLSIFAFPMFMGSKNFGSVYLYFTLIMVLSLSLILTEKLEWLIIPLGMIGMCIHEDFLFTNTSLILVLLLYKICFAEKNRTKLKHLIVLVLFLSSTISLFIYFTYHSQYNGDLELIAEELKIAAKALSQDGLTYNPIIIKHDILGMDLAPLIAEYRQDNAQDFPIFCLLFAPYIYYGLRFFVQLVQNKESTPKMRFLYLACLLGGTSMIPLFLCKTDFGVYIFNLFFYYIGILILGLTLHDQTMHNHFDALKEELKKITPLHFIWFLYPFILTPFKGVTISTQIHAWAEVLFTELSFFLPLQ